MKTRNWALSCGLSPGSSRFSRVGRHRPVVVLARAVDAGERLLVQQADQAVLVGGLAQDLHASGSGGRSARLLFSKIGAISYWLGATSLWRVLTGTPSLNSSRFALGHVGQDALGDGAEVLVFQLLALGRRRAEQRAAGGDQVGAGVVEVLVDQEVFLLGADGGEDLAASFLPNSLRMRRAWLLRASIDRSSGVFLSRASPVQLRNAVGMTSVEPLGFSMM